MFEHVPYSKKGGVLPWISPLPRPKQPTYHLHETQVRTNDTMLLQHSSVIINISIINLRSLFIRSMKATCFCQLLGSCIKSSWIHAFTQAQNQSNMKKESKAFHKAEWLDSGKMVRNNFDLHGFVWTERLSDMKSNPNDMNLVSC